MWVQHKLYMKSLLPKCYIHHFNEFSNPFFFFFTFLFIYTVLCKYSLLCNQTFMFRAKILQQHGPVCENEKCGGCPQESFGCESAAYLTGMSFHLCHQCFPQHFGWGRQIIRHSFGLLQTIRCNQRAITLDTFDYSEKPRARLARMCPAVISAITCANDGCKCVKRLKYLIIYI